jgi:hypothetical protein
VAAAGGSTQKMAVGAAAVLIVLGIAWARCSKKSDSVEATATTAASAEANASATAAASARPAPTGGLVPPLAAQHVGADVVVAVLDATAGGVRVQRIDSADAVAADRIVLSDVAASSDSDLKLGAAAEGAFVTWRGLRGGKLVRQLVGLGQDLQPKGEPIETPAASCAVRDGIWSSSGVEAALRRWPGSGATTRQALPPDKDTSLLCGPRRAYAVIEEEEKTALLPLGGDAGSGVTLLREHDFGDDEQRELAEFAIGDDVGVVRLGGSGRSTSSRPRSGGTTMSSRSTRPRARCSSSTPQTTPRRPTRPIPAPPP